MCGRLQLALIRPACLPPLSLNRYDSGPILVLGVVVCSQFFIDGLLPPLTWHAFTLPSWTWYSSSYVRHKFRLWNSWLFFFYFTPCFWYSFPFSFCLVVFVHRCLYMMAARLPPVSPTASRFDGPLNSGCRWRQTTEGWREARPSSLGRQQLTAPNSSEAPQG